jgi:hypothetical protein
VSDIAALVEKCCDDWREPDEAALLSLPDYSCAENGSYQDPTVEL